MPNNYIIAANEVTSMMLNHPPTTVFERVSDRTSRHSQHVTWAVRGKGTHNRVICPIWQHLFPRHVVKAEHAWDDYTPHGPVQGSEEQYTYTDQTVDVVWDRRRVANTIRGLEERRDHHCEMTLVRMGEVDDS